jgi:hypothetical protein
MKNRDSQTTLVISSTLGGTMLPIQSIWGGKTAASLPSRQAVNEADEKGFTYGHGDKRHWSSLETTKAVCGSQEWDATASCSSCLLQWVKEILVPHLERVKARENLPSDQHAILLLDMWPIHTAKKEPHFFLPWFLREYPWIHPIFIVGGCTYNDLL